MIRQENLTNYWILDSLLPTELAEALLVNWEKKHELGIVEEIEMFLANDVWQKHLTSLTGIEDLLFDPTYFGAGFHEYGDSAGVESVLDYSFQPHRGWYRRLKLVLFLNKHWKRSWGGCLELHADPENPESDYWLSVVPSFNRGVLFQTTRKSWNSIEQVFLPSAVRKETLKTLVCYWYTTEAPLWAVEPGNTLYCDTGLTVRDE